MRKHQHKMCYSGKEDLSGSDADFYGFSFNGSPSATFSNRYFKKSGHNSDARSISGKFFK